MSASVTGCRADDEDDIEQVSRLLGNSDGEALLNSMCGWLVRLRGSPSKVAAEGGGEIGFRSSKVDRFPIATFFGREPLLGRGGGERDGKS